MSESAAPASNSHSPHDIKPIQVLQLSIAGVDCPAIWQSSDSDVAVIMVNGGAQTRVGSHRQYIRLSRSLARVNIASLRFDLPGFGDHSGPSTDFLTIHQLLPDICRQLLQAQPKIKRLILLGLCDGASAIVLSQPLLPANCIGFILINPWVRQEQSYARTMLKDYYLKRLTSVELWRKIFSGRVAITSFFREISRLLRQNWKSRSAPTEQTRLCVNATVDNFVQLMKNHWQQNVGKVMVLTSGQDLTASEFLNLCHSDPQFKALLAAADWRHAEDANHTFASIDQQHWLEQQVCQFVDLLAFSTNEDSIKRVQ